jgi:lipopolysaccharide transport system ATP-binding protein
MNAIEQICNRLIYIDKGEISYDSGDVRGGIQLYLDQGLSDTNYEWTPQGSQFQNSYFTPLSLYLTDGDEKRIKQSISNSRDVFINLLFELKQLDPAFCIGITIYSDDNQLFFWSYQTDEVEEDWPELRLGINRLRAKLPKHLLNEGSYRLSIIASLHHREWLLQPGSLSPSITIQIQGGLSNSPYWTGRRPGLIAPILTWESVENNS